MDKKNNFLETILGGQSIGNKICLVGSVFTVILLVVYSIYGIVYNYLDTMVEIFLILGILSAAVGGIYAGKVRIAGFLKLIAVMMICGAFALFFYNSYPVWADRLNNITMYSSRGTLVPVIALCVMFVVDLVGLMVSCYMYDGGERA